MAKNPVVYAEQDLKVHQCYLDAKNVSEEIHIARGELSQHMAAVRHVTEKLSDRESLVTADAFAEAAGESVAARERIAKFALSKDLELRELRQQLIQNRNSVDFFEQMIKARERQLEVEVARMHELGGLLFFYAAVKLADHKETA